MLTETMCKELSSQLIHSQSCQVSLHFAQFLLPSITVTEQRFSYKARYLLLHYTDTVLGNLNVK